MNLTCPCCHASNSYEQFTQDEAARELLAKREQTPAGLWPHLIAYLGLFRSPKRALAWSRALRLAQDATEIPADPALLAVALVETVEAMRAKREAGDVRPLKNHNYLKRVLESVNPICTEATAGATLAIAQGQAQGLQEQGQAQGLPLRHRGKRAQAITALQQWAGEDWRRREIAQGLQALIALSRPGTPGADTITLTADVWELALCGSYRLEVEQVDGPRLFKAFKGLIKQPLKEWPEPAVLKAHMPKRPHVDSLNEPARSDDETKRGVNAARKIMEGL